MCIGATLSKALQMVLTELDRAVPDEQLFLPSDVRRLMNELHQVCQQIVQKTEQGSWLGKFGGAKQGALGQSSAQRAKLYPCITSRTPRQAEPTSLRVLK